MESSRNEPEQANEHEVRRGLLVMADRLFYQLNRIFLRHNVLIPELKKVLAWSGARAALNEPEFDIANRGEHSQTMAHAAVLTGMTRSQVKRATEQESLPVPLDGGELHRLVRILTAWRTEPDYQDSDGNPAVIRVRGGTPSLHQLCRKYGRDTPVRAIADLLVRNGNAEWVRTSSTQKAGKSLRLLHAVVREDGVTPNLVSLAAQITSDFSFSLQQRLNPATRRVPIFREGYFNDIDPQKEEEVLDALEKEISACNKRCVDLMRRYRVEKGVEGVRVGVGLYSFHRAPLLAELEDQQID